MEINKGKGSLSKINVIKSTIYHLHYRNGAGRSCAKTGFECGPCKEGFEELPQANKQVSERCVPVKTSPSPTLKEVTPSSTEATKPGK